MRRTVVLLAIASGLVVSQAPASAGGWWTTLDFHDQYIGIGESLTVKIDEVLFHSIRAADRAEHTEYFAYLVTDFDHQSLGRAMSRANPKDWWQPLSQAYQIGTVTLLGRDANLTRGRVHLRVAEVPPGRYWLMLCDAGCRTPLANHVPVPVNVTSEVLAAQTARRLHDANERLTLALARVRRDARQTQRHLRRVEATAAEASDTSTAPEQAPVTERDTTPSWIPYAGWFLAGGLVSFTILRRRLRAVPADIIFERVPDDARELIKTP